MGCPITAFDLFMNRSERDYLCVHLILTKTGNVPSSCAIVDFPVALVQPGCVGGASLAAVIHVLDHRGGVEPGTVPKCADPGTMAWNLFFFVLFVLLLAETSPTGATGAAGVSIFF